MEPKFEKAVDGIYRLDVPFDHLYTSVFLVEGETPTVIDTATTRQDVETMILPALAARGISKDTAGTLLITHTHGDHSGGTPSLLELLPAFHQEVLATRGTHGTLTAYPLAGHTMSSMGYLDSRTGALICGDGLQFFGVGKYGCSVMDADAYESTLQLIAELDPDTIIPSHDFVGGAAIACGRENARALLKQAVDCWQTLKQFVLTQYEKTPDPEQIVLQYRTDHPDLPPLPRITVKAILAQAGK